MKDSGSNVFVLQELYFCIALQVLANVWSADACGTACLEQDVCDAIHYERSLQKRTHYNDIVELSNCDKSPKAGLHGCAHWAPYYKGFWHNLDQLRFNTKLF